MSSKYQFFKKGQIIRKGDTLHIPFGEIKPSVFKVIEVNKRKNILRAKVLKEVYKGPEKYKIDSVIDIGGYIFKGYWCFRVDRKKV